MTWRRDVYNGLANVNLGFEQLNDSLESLQKAGILDEGALDAMSADIDEFWTAITYAILCELHERETANNHVYEEMRTIIAGHKKPLNPREWRWRTRLARRRTKQRTRKTRAKRLAARKAGKNKPVIR